ncbi:MAG: zinc ribbon domain-containing protein, partial [Clostridium celatum]|nr:zinc ribbon domain-containing protein [Clostridium celatum]
MALISCPKCNQPISEKASRCPKCGYILQKPSKKYSIEFKPKKGNIFNENSITPGSADNMKHTFCNTKKKKILMFSAVAIIILILLLLNTGTSVKDASISKWVLTDETDDSYSYEGTIESEQKKPFVAVVAESSNTEEMPQLVYMKNGTGTIDVYEDSDDDPSKKYKVIGYLNGEAIDESDLTIKCTEGDYIDLSFSDESFCLVSIDLNLNHPRTGLLIFDVINNLTNEVEKNISTVIVDGKGKDIYHTKLPYKSRGIDISVVPKFFCKSKTVTQADFFTKKDYIVSKENTSYSQGYSGKKVLSSYDLDDGYILYTKELKKGGNKDNLNV